MQPISLKMCPFCLTHTYMALHFPPVAVVFFLATSLPRALLAHRLPVIEDEPPKAKTSALIYCVAHTGKHCLDCGKHSIRIH